MSASLNALAGVWLVFSPWALGFYLVPAATWNAVAVGAAVLVVVARRLGPSGRVAFSWLNGLLGLWLISSPFVLGYTDATAATANAIVVGSLIVALSLYAALAGRTSAMLPPK